jgi:hypothetical protein
MPQQELAFDRIRESLISGFPELWERIESTFGSYHNPEEETPEAYLIFEDVVKKTVFELLESGDNDPLLTRLFFFFERMANSPDPNVSRDLLGIAILEPLVHRTNSLRKAWKYMGPRTRELARAESLSQNKPLDSG